MKKAITILFLLMLQKGFSQTTDKRFIGLDSTFNRVLKDWNCAGFSVAVIEKDKVIYAKGFGFADFEKKIPLPKIHFMPLEAVQRLLLARFWGFYKKKEK